MVRAHRMDGPAAEYAPFAAGPGILSGASTRCRGAAERVWIPA